MTKQNFMAMSLESGLKYVDLLCEPDDNICTLKGILNGLYCDDHGNVDCEINDCMPILRPLDLTKEIEHGGEKFVPIVELAKTAFGYLDASKINFKAESSGNIYSCSLNKILHFSLDSNDNSFIAIHNGKTVCVPKQLELFQKLISWHFDIYNLISKNQAIDINILETNPYK